MNKKFFIWLTFAVLLLLGAILRFRGIFLGTFAFTYDVGRDLLAVKDLISSHKFTLIGQTSGQGGLFYEPWWYWIIALPFFLSGGSPTAIAFFIACLGLVTAFLAFWWGKRYFDDACGLLLAGIICLGSFFIDTSSQIWNPNLLVILTLVDLIFLANIKKLKSWQLILFGFLLVLTLEMELVFGAIFILAILVSLILWQRKLFLSRQMVQVVLGMLLGELPRFLFELRHGFLEAKILPNIFITHQEQQLDRALRVKMFIEQWKYVLPNLSGILIAAFSIFAVVLFVYEVKKEKDKKKRLFQLELITMIIVFFVAMLVYPRGFWTYYVFGLPVMFAVFLTFSFSCLIKIIPRALVIVTVLIYLLAVINPMKTWEGIQSPNFIGNASVYRNQLAVIDYVYQQAKGYDFNYIAYTPPQIEYTWRYLFAWYGKQKYHYEPVIKRQERFYVIIEPDPGYEDRITMWLKIRENDGSFVKKYTLPSGIIVQTRSRPKE